MAKLRNPYVEQMLWNNNYGRVRRYVLEKTMVICSEHIREIIDNLKLCQKYRLYDDTISLLKRIIYIYGYIGSQIKNIYLYLSINKKIFKFYIKYRAKLIKRDKFDVYNELNNNCDDIEYFLSRRISTDISDIIDSKLFNLCVKKMMKYNFVDNEKIINKLFKNNNYEITENDICYAFSNKREFRLSVLGIKMTT